MAGHAVIRELCIQSQWWEWGKEDISFLLLFSPQVWLHAVKFPCRLLTWGDLCWGKYSPAPLTPCRPREFLVFKKLQKHESVELLHKLNWSYSSLRNVLSWSLFFFFPIKLFICFLYCIFNTWQNITAFAGDKLSKDFYNLLFLLSRARFLHMANFPVFCLVFCVVPRCMGFYCFTSETAVGQASLLPRNALWYSA